MGASASNCRPGSIPHYTKLIREEKQPEFPADVSVLSRKKNEAERLISILRDAAIRHMWLSEEDVSSLPAFPQGDTVDDRCRRFLHLAKIAILSMPLFANFANCVPGFQLLNKEDQIMLLETRAEELLLIHFSSKYFLGVDSLRLLPNQTFYSRGLFHNTYRSSSIVDDMFDFFKRVAYLGMDDAEYALLQAVIVFSDCPNLLEPVQVKELHNLYFQALCEYSGKKRSWSSLMPEMRQHLSKLAGKVNKLFSSFRITMEDVDSVLENSGCCEPRQESLHKAPLLSGAGLQKVSPPWPEKREEENKRKNEKKSNSERPKNFSVV